MFHTVFILLGFMVSVACVGGVIWLLFFVKEKKKLMGWLQFGIFDAFFWVLAFGPTISILAK